METFDRENQYQSRKNHAHVKKTLKFISEYKIPQRHSDDSIRGNGLICEQTNRGKENIGFRLKKSSMGMTAIRLHY